MKAWEPYYSAHQREWSVWNGEEEVRDERGEIRWFISAQDAYDWLAEQHEAKAASHS